MPVQPGYQETMVPFGAWLPDQGKNTAKPGFPLFWVNGSPVDLDDALNVIWTGGTYRPFLAPVAQGAACPITATDGFSCLLTTGITQLPWLVVGDANGNCAYSTNHGTSWTQCLTGSLAGGIWSFVVYSECIYAVNGQNGIWVMDLTAPTPAFSNLSANAPTNVHALGIIGDFLVAGDIGTSPVGAPTGGNVITWSGLAAPTTWDIPNTQQARADQSGAQSLPSELGPVRFITSGQALGMVFQQNGITRAQYVGGDIVFSFYTYERKRGLVTPRAAAQVGNTVFYLSNDGFYATDGTEVQPIGYSKVNRWFIGDCTNLNGVYAAADIPNSLIVWNYPSATNASGYGQIIYNFAEGNWSRGNYACPVLFQDFYEGNAASYTPALFDVNQKINQFIGAPTDSELTTKDFRFDPSHHSLVVSLRVLCDNASATAGVAARNQDSDPQTFVGYGAPEPVSRQISVRADGYMHSANVKIPGAFTYAQGIGYKYVNRGRR